MKNEDVMPMTNQELIRHLRKFPLNAVVGFRDLNFGGKLAEAYPEEFVYEEKTNEILIGGVFQEACD